MHLPPWATKVLVTLTLDNTRVDHEVAVVVAVPGGRCDVPVPDRVDRRAGDPNRRSTEDKVDSSVGIRPQIGMTRSEQGQVECI